MKSFRVILSLLAIAVSISSCHSPEVEVTANYSVVIYPNNDDLFTMHNGQTYTFYAVITPKSECQSTGSYHWVIGSPGQLAYIDSGEISVSEVRNALASKYKSVYDIPDDSFCSFCTAKASTYSIGSLAVNISFVPSSTMLPSYTKYMRVTW